MNYTRHLLSCKLLFTFIIALFFSKEGLSQIEFSTAGFYNSPNTARVVKVLNPGWLFFKGDFKDAQSENCNTDTWEKVSLPHGIEYLPEEASGCVNYQGVVWYRKTIYPKLDTLKDKNNRFFIHFEAIMGKSKIYINGVLVKEHFGGYLPIEIDITDYLKPKTVIAVWADNSNDSSYPPGKPQETLDFTYFGGIYRDCYLIQTGGVFVASPHNEDITASNGGSTFITKEIINNSSTTISKILMKTSIFNKSTDKLSITATFSIYKDSLSSSFYDTTIKVKLTKDVPTHLSIESSLLNAELWSPEFPNLYWFTITLKDKNGSILDSYRKKVGIRTVEFKQAQGLFLNGKPYSKPLMGANRHQDFAILGNAMTNGLHYRDAFKLKDAGMNLIRNAHCPQDPAFMDACNELGLFVIINTPGWQFFNNENPLFVERVYDDLKQLIRRDRSHPSMLLWEPLLNETWQPLNFVEKVVKTVKEEYPYPNCNLACDEEVARNSLFNIHYGHPQNGDSGWGIKHLDSTKNYLTREWGDNVDTWNSHNSPSRASKRWGENPQIIQSRHYANPSYESNSTSYNSLCKAFTNSRSHVGGSVWHSFDHQRGYHPDPFYGGIMDSYRLPKFSYYMFSSQRELSKESSKYGSGAILFIANALTPFSSNDLEIYTNCDKIKLKSFALKNDTTIFRDKKEIGMPSPIITIKNGYDFMKDKSLSRGGKENSVIIEALCYQNDKIVLKETLSPSRREDSIILYTDSCIKLQSDGSSKIVVVASIVDTEGSIKRLSNKEIFFTVSGPARIVTPDGLSLTTKKGLIWGEAPIILESTLDTGVVIIKAELTPLGINSAKGSSFYLNSISSTLEFLYERELTVKPLNSKDYVSTSSESISIDKELIKQELKKVEQDQRDFGEK